jgi:tetratricopeptide (TPR) repeat protein
LAYHFDAAGLVEPTIGYLHRAGQRAFQMSANEEAIRLLERAIALLTTLPESPDRDGRELELLVALGAPVMAVRGYAAPAADRIGNRVWELCEQLEGPSPMGAMALIGLTQTLSVLARWEEAAATSRRALTIAADLDDATLRVLAGVKLGYSRHWLGELAAGHEDMQRARDLHDPDRDTWLMYAFGIEPVVEALVWDASNTGLRGYADQALAMGDRGIEVARRLEHPFTLSHALAVGGANLRMMRGDYRAALTFIDELEAIATTEHYPFWAAGVDIYRGVAIGHLGDPDTGIGLIRHGLDGWHSMGVNAFQAWYAAEVAELEWLRGDPSRGLELIELARADAGTTGERLSGVYLAVQRGTLSRARSDDATSALKAAIDAARAIGARILELRAATQLAALLEDQHQTAEAHRLLAPIYNWFTEGLNTPDLVAARRVLERL